MTGDEYGRYVHRVDATVALLSSVAVTLPDVWTDDEPTLRAAAEGLDGVLTALLYGLRGDDLGAAVERAHDALRAHFDPENRYHTAGQ